MIELEDFFEDVIGKTLRGTGMADGVLSFLTNVDEDLIAKLKDGEFNEDAVRAVAPSLGLDADSLVVLVIVPGVRRMLSLMDSSSSTLTSMAR
jgi:hypothetical protein